MEWILALFGVAAVFVLTMISGMVWKHIHRHQADRMHQYGDRERNKYGLWK